MSEIERLVHTPIAHALGWTLFHSLWEGALVALVLLAILFVVRSQQARYGWACVAMAGVACGFVLTFSLIWSRGGGDLMTVTHHIASGPVVENHLLTSPPTRLGSEDLLPWLAPFWILGVLMFQLRTVAGWMAVQRMRDRGVCRAPSPWPQRLEQLGARMRVSRPVVLLESCLTEVPVVIGYWRPVILAPAGMLAGMPAGQVEAILLHELAHIRRWDYPVNLLQKGIEGFLFYHPAIWWISHVIRAERENCCDDLAVAASGDAREYAAALATLEQTRWTAQDAVLAATGGSLVKRIRRLVYQPEGFARAPFLSAGILTIVAAGALIAWQAATPAADPSSPQTKISPYTKWLNEDVVYIINVQERAAFLGLRTDDERNLFIQQFWLRRDPTPGTPRNEFQEEHYRRIVYANQHFAWKAHFGWQTDRGRIHIQFGWPDEKESHPSGLPAQGNVAATNYPVEQWLYYHIKDVGDRVIVDFVDPEKTGEYKMTEDPNPSGGKRVPR